MRGTPWLVGLLCVMLVVVPTSLFAGAQEPRSPDAPARDASGATRFQEWSGQSVLHFKGACLDEIARCVAETEREDGAFFLPAASGGGSIVISWRPVNDSLRVLKARVAGVEIVGESPIRMEFNGLEAGDHAIRIEPARRIVGTYDQTADWVATFAIGQAPERIDTLGQSIFRSVTPCILTLCDPETTVASDTFITSWTSRGTLLADWNPNDGPLRIAIRGTDLVTQGEPPLTLDVYSLPPGEYAVDATPPLLGGPLSEIAVSWRATLEPEL